MAEFSESDIGPSPLEDESTRPPENDATKLASPETANEVLIVLAGKSGAGKSTLVKTLLNEEMDVELSAKPITEVAERHSIVKNGVTITIVDTPGFVNKEVKESQKKFHLLVFCISVSPGSKFHDANPVIMRKLQDMYGAGIWKHCVVVFTFSNAAWERARKGSTQEEAIAQYKQYLEEYAKSFQGKLEELSVKNVAIKTIFSHGNNQPPDPNIIVAVPAGDEPEDPVLLEMDTSGWVDEVFFEMIRKCKCNDKLAQYRYGREKVKKVLKMLGIIGGSAAITTPAALLGAGVGAAAGIVGGPAGIVIGACTGGSIGFAAGAAISERASRKIIKKNKKT